MVTTIWLVECLTALRLKAWLSVPSIEPAYSGTKVAMISLRLAAVNNAVLLSSQPLDKETAIYIRFSIQ